MVRTPILIAEDDEAIMLLEKRILEDAGYAVDCAISGDQALEMAKQNRYAVIVADIMMPGLDGIDLTKEIAKIYRRTVPVLLVTAVHDALNAAHSRDARPMSTLQKPFSPQALLTAVKLLESQGKTSGAVQKTSPRTNAKPSKSLNSQSISKRKKSWLEKLLHPSDSSKK
jgi:DNA-binding response OmpR family regulator